MGELNLRIFRGINGWPQSWAPFLRLFSEAVNQTWFKLFVLILLAGMLLRSAYTRATALLALLAVLLANGSTDLWKNFLPEPRPFQEIPDVLLRAGTTIHAGTASAHAANMAAVATIFLVRQRWWGMPWFIAAFLTGVSRVYVGVHYPYQILLGWMSGVLCALVVLSAHRILFRKRTSVESGEPKLADSEARP